MSLQALVTGGAGFIGSHLARRLLELGYHVRVLDNFCTGKRTNLGNEMADIEWFEADIRNHQAVRDAARGVSCIWHQAALASVPRSVEDPLTTHEVNVTGSLNVLVAARDEGVPRVVLASSSSVYGDTPVLPKVESMHPQPVSPYAAQKLAVEVYARQFHLHYGIAAICLRYFNVFGPRQDPNSPYAAVLPRFVRRIREGQRPIIYGDGEQTRDFTYVDNAVEANILASNASSIGGNVYNVASGQQTRVIDLATAVADAMSWKGGIEFQPNRAGDVVHSYAEISSAHEAFGYTPIVSFEEGLRRTLAWFDDHPL